MDWYYWLGVALAVVAAVAGIGIYKWAKLLRESGEVLTTIGTALEDGDITPAELASIIKEVRDVGGAWADVLTELKKFLPKK